MQLLRHRWRPFVSAVALGLVLGVLLTPVGIAHLDQTPAVCDRPAAAHAGEARVLSVSAFELHEHCFTCHWLQSFRSTLLASGAVVLDANDVCFIPVLTAVHVESYSRHSLPARAPPSSC